MKIFADASVFQTRADSDAYHYQRGTPVSIFHLMGVLSFKREVLKKLQDHQQALQSRCHYLDLTIDSMRDRMLRIRQIVGTGMLEKYAMGKEAEDELVNFIYANKHKLREISLRMVLKIADLWKMAPDRYQHLAEQTCMRPGA